MSSCYLKSLGRMEVMASRSGLNPNAPMFVPHVYRTVEDFSDEWWALIQSTPWFRDYWLQECYHDPQDFDLDFGLPDHFLDSFFYDEDEFLQREGKEENNCREVVKTGGKKWERRGGVEVPKYAEKVPKYVNVKVTPRMIQQPR